MTTTPIGSLMMVNLDCPNPAVLADFYSQVLGWKITHSEDLYAMISDGSTSIGFGRADDYQPPSWPDVESGKRFHLDFYVDDLDVAAKACEALGATTPEFQPGDGQWRIMLDPAGHPLCLCPRP